MVEYRIHHSMRDAKGSVLQMQYSVRQATPDDLPSITEIYNQGIVDGLATLESDLRSEEERRIWMSSKSDRHKILVIVDEADSICGWASLNSYNDRACFDGVADVSIYIHRDRRGIGLGKRLLDALSAEARVQGFHKLVLNALNANETGKKLYRFIGFREVGVYHKHGYREGKWLDVVIMEKLLY